MRRDLLDEILYRLEDVPVPVHTGESMPSVGIAPNSVGPRAKPRRILMSGRKSPPASGKELNRIAPPLYQVLPIVRACGHARLSPSS